MEESGFPRLPWKQKNAGSNPALYTKFEPRYPRSNLVCMTKWTKEYQKEYDRQRHKAQSKEKGFRQDKRRKELRIWILAYKSERGCNRCPERHPACLQFHHLRDKKAQIADMVRLGHGKENILEEIAKCELICGNCHAKEHFKSLG